MIDRKLILGRDSHGVMTRVKIVMEAALDTQKHPNSLCCTGTYHSTSSKECDSVSRHQTKSTGPPHKGVKMAAQAPLGERRSASKTQDHNLPVQLFSGSATYPMRQRLRVHLYHGRMPQGVSFFIHSAEMTRQQWQVGHILP